jgi:ubiquinone/menaquinone biosynthesis C-methylase UbiE
MIENASPSDSGRGYVLGHSEREIARLKAQASLIDPVTRRFFEAAGVQSGMRVLDVGSGAGDVAFLASELVGARGEVIGVDTSPAALAVARSRAAERGIANVAFRDGDPSEMSFDRPFDAVIGRYVLQFQREPGAMLRKLAGHARPGAVIVFHEIDWAGLSSSPPVPTFDRCASWGEEAMRRHGTETHMGRKLHAAFLEAGLPAPGMRLDAPAGGWPACRAWLEMFKELLSTLLPQMERFGLADASALQLDTLVDRIGAEAQATRSVIFGHFQIGAWTRNP